jgi:hypothetical protein
MGWMFQTFAKQKSDLIDTLVLGAQYCGMMGFPYHNTILRNTPLSS